MKEATAVARPARAGAAVMENAAPLTASGGPGKGAVATATPIVHASRVPEVTTAPALMSGGPAGAMMETRWAAMPAVRPARTGAAAAANATPVTLSGGPGRGAVPKATEIVRAHPVPGGLTVNPLPARAFVAGPGATTAIVRAAAPTRKAALGSPAAPAGRLKAPASGVMTTTAPMSGDHAGVMTTTGPGSGGHAGAMTATGPGIHGHAGVMTPAPVATTAVAHPARAGRRMTGHASAPTLNGMANGHMADAALAERGMRGATADAEAATSTVKHAPIARTWAATLAAPLRRTFRRPAAAAPAR